MKRHSIVLLAIVLCLVVSQARADWTQIVYPGATSTMPYAISGTTIVGQCFGVDTDSFIYNGSTFTDLENPDTFCVLAYGIDGDNIVGWSENRNGTNGGFIYNGLTWDFISYPGADMSEFSGIDGSNIVGNMRDAGGLNWDKFFIYDGSTWTTYNYQGADAQDISGTNIVGILQGTGSSFLFDGTTMTTLEFPGAIITEAHSIDGMYIVGNYYGDPLAGDDAVHGFIYDGTTWTTLDYPGSYYTVALGIDGDSIVGYYGNYGDTNTYGFLYTPDDVIPVPAPGAFVLGCIGLSFAGLRLRRRAT